MKLDDLGDDSFAFQSCGSCLDSATDVRLSNCCRSIKSWGRARLFAIYLFPLSSTRDPDRIFGVVALHNWRTWDICFSYLVMTVYSLFPFILFVYFLGSQKRQNKSWLTKDVVAGVRHERRLDLCPAGWKRIIFLLNLTSINSIKILLCPVDTDSNGVIHRPNQKKREQGR